MEQELGAAEGDHPLVICLRAGNSILFAVRFVAATAFQVITAFDTRVGCSAQSLPVCSRAGSQHCRGPGHFFPKGIAVGRSQVCHCSLPG